MFRSFFLSFIVIFLSLPVKASFKIAAHADYVHFSEKEKEAYIIQLMEHVVALEARYKRETELYGYSKERFEKFQQIITRLQSELLIGHAYAAPEGKSVHPFKTWDQLSQQFLEYSTRSENNGEGNCIFAGWISKTSKKKDGSIFCKHPGFIADKLNGTTAKCGSHDKKKKNWIQCNPAVFGYKKESDKSLFCVETKNEAENSSFECMKEALKENAPDADDRKTRLEFLKNKYNDPKNFQNIFMFNYRTCVCSVTPQHFNRDYQNYIRPGNVEKESDRYRTCYGMMKMMSEIQNECRPPEFDQSIFKEFESFIASKQAVPDGLQGDSWYKDFITKELKNNKESVAAYNQLCPSESLTITDPEKEQTTKKFTCTATCTPPDQCTFEVMEEGKPDSKKTVTDSAKPSDPKQEKIEIKPETAPAGLTCPITWKTVTPGENTAGSNNPQGGGENPGNGTTGAQTGTETQTGTQDASSTQTEVPEDKTGVTEPPKASVELKVTKKEKDYYKIVAETKNDDGWTLSWSIENAGDLKVKKDWETKKDQTIDNTAGLGGDPTETDTDSDKTESENETPTNASKEIKQKRYKTSYKVCAQLKKGKESTKKDCETVDKLEKEKDKPASSSYMPQQNTQQQQPIRRSSDTSAVGIK